MSPRPESGAAERPAPQPKKKRLDRRTLRLLAWGAGAISFALPWVAVGAVVHPQGTTSAASQVVTVPAGSKVTVVKSPAGVVTGVTVATPKKGTATTAGPAAAPITTTGGSVPPPR